MSELSGSPTLRILFLVLGFLALTLGIIGIVTPILPTTPFILLAGYCFTRSSERFSTWINNHKYFGPVLRTFRDEKRIPLNIKILATLMIIISMTASAFIVRKPFVIATMASVGVGVIIYIWTFKH